MQSFRIDKINWVADLDAPTTVEISYRKSSDADTEASYTSVADNLVAGIDGVLNSPVYINNFLPATDYVIKYVIKDGGATFFQNVTSTSPVIVGDFLDKVNHVMPNMQYIDTTNTGLLDSYLPEKIGCLYTFNSSFSDILEQFANAQYTVIDNNLGIGFDKRDNEIGIKITDNVSSFISAPSDSNGNNEASIIGADGSRSYSLGIWAYFNDTEFSQPGVDGKFWLVYAGDPDKHIGIYINTSTKYVHWIHKNSSTVEEIILNHAVEANKWIRIFVRRDGTNPSDSYNNQILMVINGSYYSPSTPTYFSSASNYAGRNSQPIYIGMGKQDSNSNLIPTKGVYHYFYFRTGLTDNNLRERILNPPYPKVIIANPDLSGEFQITHEYFVSLTNNKVSFVFPHNTPIGNKKMWFRTYSNERPKIDITVSAFLKRPTGFDIDFRNTSSFSANKTAIANTFNGLHKSWGGYANGGVVTDNVYFQDGKLVLEAHGEKYDGNVQGVNRDGTPKVHTIQNDPIWGSDPKLNQSWTERTGCCIVSKEYLGFGRYLIRTKIPQKLGIAPAWWLFHYEEVYQNTPDYELLLSEGLKREGNFADGYYLVRNHEIDIEQPSHLAMGVFNGWSEVATNVIFFNINAQYHIGIQNDTTANNGLWKYNGSGSANNKSNWTKVGTDIKPVYQPSFDNFKCNTWIGETGSGNGWRYKDPLIPDTQNDEVYLANLTPIGQPANDDNFHDYEWRWYKDRVEFYFDGVLKQTNTAFIPDIPSRLTIGPWFPSGTSSNGSIAPWLPDPTKTWAGSPADWNYQKFIVERILFEPFTDIQAGGSNRLIGESYPYDGMKSFSV